MIREMADGSEMVSRFWLGNFDVRIPLVGRLMHKRVNSVESRLREVPDQFGLDLLRHCAEEMNHLARFLPRLYEDVTHSAPSS